MPDVASRAVVRGSGLVHPASLTASPEKQYRGDRPSPARDPGAGSAELLTEFSALHPGTAKQLAVLLLRHALAPLLDD
ncbi:conserved hypothetical protein [Mycolicibacter sinensis]|uniref:Uncharacterized protein n=1 Tax=Mycolicibacter sinensis (strain JDM601) TaxID=875328 RepID=F5Z1J6_MYCSD|nr:conserved hypothetical protein [Mycolicibacter sinensis]